MKIKRKKKQMAEKYCYIYPNYSNEFSNVEKAIEHLMTMTPLIFEGYLQTCYHNIERKPDCRGWNGIDGSKCECGNATVYLEIENVEEDSTKPPVWIAFGSAKICHGFARESLSVNNNKIKI